MQASDPVRGIPRTPLHTTSEPVCSKRWLRWLLLFFSCGVVLGCPERARAHELAIDRLLLWPDREGIVLLGQVSFDPELTRDLDAPLKVGAATLAVEQFLQQNLEIRFDGHTCRPTFQVRELYTRGGAVPGDIVMLRCPYPAQAQQLSVRLAATFDSLVVTVSGFDEANSEARQSVLLRGGETSPPYLLGSAPPAAWKEGGPEQFEPPATSNPKIIGAPGVETIPPTTADLARSSLKRRAPAGFAEQSVWQVVWQYLWVGFAHILPGGLDHVLFVAGLALGARRRWRWLVLELSLFTVAHTLTLGLGAMELLVVPGSIVEPLIALSIGFVAAENLLDRAYSRKRLLLVLLFGLVHGQGFAGALSELELPQGALLSALLGFNLGVELGQLLVAFLMTLLLLVVSRRWQERLVVLPICFLTIAIAAYWVLDRTLS